MATHVVKGTYKQTYDLVGSGDLWKFTADSVIAPIYEAGFSQFGIREGDLNNNIIRVYGEVHAFRGTGIISSGTNTAILIGEGALVKGFDGVSISGPDSQVTNQGSIIGNKGESYGFHSSGENGELNNFGIIRAATFGAEFHGANSLIINEKSGHIEAGVTAIYLAAPAGSNDRFENHGTVVGGQAILGNLGDDTIINHGKMSGTIVLNDGNDVFDNRGGEINNPVVGGTGDDTLFTDSSSVTLQEDLNGGVDTVKSTVSYTLSDNVELLYLLGRKDIDGKGNKESNYIAGNAGDNVLSGFGNNDGLDGQGGNDKLIGGAGRDHFYFGTGYGTDTIADLKAADDFVILTNWSAIRSFSDLKGNATNHGDDVWISTGHDTLVIDGYHKADLHEITFQYAM